jgi:CarD family transcriptional regulator
MKNEYVSYRGHGIGRVLERKTMNDIEFVSIEILATDFKIMVPKTSLNDCYRELMDASTAAKVRALMKVPNDFINNQEHQTWNRRYRRLMEKVTSNSPILMAEVVAELNNRKLDGELSFGERKLLDASKTMLEVELSLVNESRD